MPGGAAAGDGLPAVARMYNLYQPYDPVAYRYQADGRKTAHSRMHGICQGCDTLSADDVHCAIWAGHPDDAFGLGVATGRVGHSVETTPHNGCDAALCWAQDGAAGGDGR